MTENIRNFVIISHIDHGKSTLADRFLELTSTVKEKEMRPQYLDSMDLEKEKGITIKMHPVRMIWRSESGLEYILNLIDTPGHIDFSYEISRALACVEGAILLVDASKGIQAQTLFNLEMAKNQGLEVIGAVNKIDLPNAQVNEAKKELSSLLKTNEEEILLISGKQGTNVGDLLRILIEKFPAPKKYDSNFLKGLIFDSKYDSFAGVILFVRIFEGEVKKGDNIYLMAKNIEGEVKEVGYFLPFLSPAQGLKEGEIGYIKSTIKDPSKVKVGDTIISPKLKTQSLKLEIRPLPGYKEPKPVLYLSLYPENPEDFDNLKIGLEKLKLNDAALNFQQESNPALGRGFRGGFLGSLHAEITARRLEKVFGLNLITTSPQVVFKILKTDGSEIIVSSPSLWPNPSLIKEVQEPWTRLEIICPEKYLAQTFKVIQGFKAEILETKILAAGKFLYVAQAPLREIITGNFYDKLKSVSQGYASFNFKISGFKTADLVKIDILVAKEPQEPFARVVVKEAAFLEAKKILQKLKEVLPAQQFDLVLQAAINGKIIARETIRALRKDVTAPLYGGDVTRKRKLLEIQKKGKKELKSKARINIPPQVFLEMFK